MTWFYIHLGINGNGPWYAFWSGIGSDLGEFSIVAVLLRSVNCHEKGCWRLGFQHNGHHVCHKHRKVN